MAERPKKERSQAVDDIDPDHILSGSDSSPIISQFYDEDQGEQGKVDDTPVERMDTSDTPGLIREIESQVQVEIPQIPPPYANSDEESNLLSLGDLDEVDPARGRRRKRDKGKKPLARDPNQGKILKHNQPTVKFITGIVDQKLEGMDKRLEDMQNKMMEVLNQFKIPKVPPPVQPPTPALREQRDPYLSPQPSGSGIQRKAPTRSTGPTDRSPGVLRGPSFKIIGPTDRLDKPPALRMPPEELERRKAGLPKRWYFSDGTYTEKPNEYQVLRDKARRKRYRESRSSSLGSRSRESKAPRQESPQVRTLETRGRSPPRKAFSKEISPPRWNRQYSPARRNLPEEVPSPPRKPTPPITTLEELEASSREPKICAECEAQSEGRRCRRCNTPVVDNFIYQTIWVYPTTTGFWYHPEADEPYFVSRANARRHGLLEPGTVGPNGNRVKGGNMVITREEAEALEARYPSNTQ